MALNPSLTKALTAMVAGVAVSAGMWAAPLGAAPRDTDIDTERVRTTDVRPRDDRRPDVEVLRLRCRPATDHPNVAGCAWSEVRSERAVGYQLWRIVDRGHREMTYEGRLDTLKTLDRVPADAKVVRYAVLAVNEDGRIVARSRVAKVRLGDDRPSDERVAQRRRAARTR